MKKWLLLLVGLLCCASLAWAGFGYQVQMAGPVPSTPAYNCISLTGDLLQETFNPTGYDDADWTEDPNNPDQDNSDALTDAPCFTGQYLKCSGSDQWSRNTVTSSAAAYVTYYMYITAESVADATDIDIGRTEGSNVYFELNDAAGALSVSFYIGSQLGDVVSVSLNTQYLVQYYYDNTGNTFQWYIYDKDETLLGSYSGAASILNNLTGVLIGPVNNSVSSTMYFDLVDVSTTGWPTGSPAK